MCGRCLSDGLLPRHVRHPHNQGHPSVHHGCVELRREGPSCGIGAATALTLAEQGFRVVVNHRDSGPQAEDVLASRLAPPHRLFIGSTAARILRVLQVPIVVIPGEEK